MPSQILFRSHRSGRNLIGSAHAKVPQQGTSWSHLRSYTDTDDVRDIAWTRRQGETLPVRVREDHGDFEILIYLGTTPYDGFAIRDSSESKTYMMEYIRQSIARSARIGQYTYRDLSEGDISSMSHMQPMNALIFICNTEIDDQIRLLAYHNDLIYLDLYHPYERDPDTDLLFFGKAIDRISYQVTYNKQQELRKKTITQAGGSYLQISTQDDIVTLLNIFFKKRYTHGYLSSS